MEGAGMNRARGRGKGGKVEANGDGGGGGGEEEGREASRRKRRRLTTPPPLSSTKNCDLLPLHHQNHPPDPDIYNAPIPRLPAKPP